MWSGVSVVVGVMVGIGEQGGEIGRFALGYMVAVSSPARLCLILVISYILFEFFEVFGLDYSSGSTFVTTKP